MNKHRINIFIALVLVLIAIAAVSALLTGRDINNTVPAQSAADAGTHAERYFDPDALAGGEPCALGKPERSAERER